MGFRPSPSANLFNAERWMEDMIVIRSLQF